MESLYAEGYSVVDFLVARSNRPEFLAFVDDGMRVGWDRALQSHYRINSVNELEQSWIDSLRKPPRRAEGQIASTHGSAEGSPASRIVERRTAPPVQPFGETTGLTARGQMQDPDGDRAHREPAATGRGRCPGIFLRRLAMGMDRIAGSPPPHRAGQSDWERRRHCRGRIRSIRGKDRCVPQASGRHDSNVPHQAAACRIVLCQLSDFLGSRTRQSTGKPEFWRTRLPENQAVTIR